MTTIRLLGCPVVTTSHGEQPLAPQRRFQLLAYLACRGGWVPRAELAMLLWEEHEMEHARRNLRRLLHDIRAIAWAGALEAQGDALRWRPATDLARFEQAFARGDWRSAMELGAGVLLDGMEVGATEAFHDWLRTEREKQRRRWVVAVTRHDPALVSFTH
jgi:DNA-binding SARP family transcriptional activator